MAEQSTREMVIETNTIVKHMAAQFDEVYHWMNGNGKIGMKAEHAVLMKEVSTLKDKEEEKEKRAWQVKLLGIGQIIMLAGLAIAIALGLK